MKFFCFLLAAGALAQTPPFPMTDASAIGEGKELFRMNCSVGYCHGLEGRAGRGPRIQGRTFERDYLYKVTRDGIPRTGMPAWKDRLNDKQIWSVVAYMMSISQPAPSGSTESAAAPSSEPATAAGPTVKKSEGPAYGDPAKGKAIFFDSANDSNCGVCHTSDGKGAGPALASVKNRPANELLRDIVAPDARYAAQYKLVEVTLKNGQKFLAIRGQDSAASARFFDVTALPPVQRSIAKSDIAKEDVQERSGMVGNYGSYTFEQLAHLVAYMKDAEVSIADLIP